MKYHYLTLLVLMTSVFTANAQSASGGRVVWGPTPIEARISYGVETGGFNLNKFSYSGVEDGSLYLTNKTSHQLLVTLSCEVKDYCNKVRNFSFEFNLPPNATKEQSLNFDASPCITVKAVGDLNTVIYNIYVIVDDIVDLTEQEANEKQRLANEKEAASAKENERLAAQKKLADAKEQESLAKANQVSQTPESATSNGATSNSTQTTNTYTPAPTQSTYEETNARINAENQRKYEEQQERYAENQRINQEQSEQFVEDASELIGMVGSLFAPSAKEDAELDAYIRAKAADIATRTNYYETIANTNIPAAKQGDRKAIETVGNNYLYINDVYNAELWFQKGADLHYPESMKGLADVYIARIYKNDISLDVTGSDRRQNFEQYLPIVLKWYREAALNGSVEAYQFFLYLDKNHRMPTYYYYVGKKVGDYSVKVPSDGAYLAVVKDAAKKGYSTANQLLGTHYSQEDKDKLLKKALKKMESKDTIGAIALYKDAADTYYSDEAMYILGSLYWNGENTTAPDSLKIKEAKRLWHASANLGNENAMLQLAELYRDGNKGIEPHKGLSDFWFRKLEASKLYGPYIFKKAKSLYENSATNATSVDMINRYIESAELGNVEAMGALAAYYRSTGTDGILANIWEQRTNAGLYEKPGQGQALFLPDKSLFAFEGEYESSNKRVYVTLKKVGHTLVMTGKMDGKVLDGQDTLYPVNSTTFFAGEIQLRFIKEEGVFKKILYIETTGDKNQVEFTRVN